MRENISCLIVSRLDLLWTFGQGIYKEDGDIKKKKNTQVHSVT